MTSIVERLAELRGQFSFDALPNTVVDKAKALVLDSLGCALGAHSSPPAQTMRKVVQQVAGHGDSTLLGTGDHASVRHGKTVE